MKKYFTIIAGLLLLLMFAQCKKDEPVTPNENTDNNGRVEIPIGMSHTDIVVSNFVEDAIPDEDGGFEIGNGRMLMAKNANNDKLIYIALYSTDFSTVKGTMEDVDRQLSAKETALYFALSVFPNGFGELSDSKFNALKNILYSLESVQQLETAIQQTVDQYGYLKEDAINGPIETVRRFFYDTLISPLMEAAGRGQKALNPPAADPDHFGQIAKIDINSSTYNADDDSWDIQTTCWNALGICVGVVEGTEISETEGMFDPWSMAAFLDPTLVSNVFSFEEVLSWQHYVDLFNDFSNVLHGNTDAFMTTGVSRWDVNFNLNRDEDAIFFVGPEFRIVQVANFVHLAWETVKFVAEMCVGNNMPEWYNFEVMVAEIAQDVNYLNRIQEWTETFDDGLFTALYFETMRKMGAFWASHGFFGVQQLEVYNSYTAMVSAFAFGCDLFVGYVEYSLCNTFYFYVGGDHAEPAEEELPGLITNSFEVVSSTQATVTGALIEEGTYGVVERGICYSTMPNPTPYGNHVVADGTDIGSFTCTLTDLQPNTKYYARSYAKNELGNVGYGNEVSFTTYSAVPIITTYPMEETTVASTSAIFKGKVEGVAFSEIVTRGFCYNTTPYFTVNTLGVSIVNAGNGTGEFTAVATGLTPGTTYYYLAYVESNGEFFHGPEMSFTTLNEDSQVATLEPENVTAVSAVLRGAVVGETTQTVTERGFCFGTLPNQGIGIYGSTKIPVGSGMGPYYYNLEGLTPGTTYYVKAYAITDLGYTLYGGEKSFYTINDDPQVVTLSVENVTDVSASLRGGVVGETSQTVTEHGFCYGTTAGQGIGNNGSNKIVVGSGLGSYAYNLENLSPRTTYYVKAYATTNCGHTIYGDELDFTTANASYGGHEYVDLGLPSGTLWATCNVGADVPEGFGDHFAWGETQPKEVYEWINYRYCNGYSPDHNLTKYCIETYYGYEGFVDNLTVLLPEDDAATANWGEGWCMPTKEQWEELMQYAGQHLQTVNGVYGSRFVASNGNSIFLPMAGMSDDEGPYGVGSFGHYWSSSLRVNTSYSNSDNAWFFKHSYAGRQMSDNDRCTGRAVRPVRSTRK